MPLILTAITGMYYQALGSKNQKRGKDNDW